MLPGIEMMIAVVIAYMIKGMCGFANTLVFTSILSFRRANINISPVELIVGYPANLYIVWRERKHLLTSIWLPLSILVVLGSVPGILLLKIGNSEVLKMMFGIVVIVLSVEMFLRENIKKEKKTNQTIMGAIGLASGILCGLFGIGALLAAYVSRTTEDSGSFRGNLCAVFIVENSVRWILYLLTGIITLQTMQTALQLIPFMVMGLLAGTYIGKKLKDTIIKKIVILFLFLSGISLVITNLLMYTS